MKPLAGFCLLFCSCTVLQNNEFRERAQGLMQGHKQVYALPYEKGRRFRVAQGYESAFSHHRDYSIDFKMPIGTPVTAARGGVVVFVRQYDTTHGIRRRNVGTGNGISIRHADSTFGHYWHLKPQGAVVAVGDTVTTGQHIGFSGNTGYTAFPHLHFEVTRQSQKSRDDFPVLFLTEKGPRFLQPLRRYRAP